MEALIYIAFNKKNIVAAISDRPFSITNHFVKEISDPVPREEWHKIIGTKLFTGEIKTPKDLKIAIICNWNDACGISTYSRFLVEAITPKVKEMRIFSEKGTPTQLDESNVIRCWERGRSVQECITQILAWEPDFVIIQHEFGIFPKASYFLQLLQGIEDIPYVVTMHSVYEHLDKSICSSAAKNIVVHSKEAKEALQRVGNNSKIFVIPHGCLEISKEEKTELWNIFQTPYPLVQFGFGFFYKGVDLVLDAIHHLKAADKKFESIFYCYLCSENAHTSVIHTQYHTTLMNKIGELDLGDNAVIIRKFQTEQTINHYLRTSKIALFPYINDPKNKVYGASGAIRIAMANGIPVIASNSHMFDDLEGVLPRPNGYIELAKEIDKVFSNETYRNDLINKIDKYIKENNWEITANRYVDTFKAISS